MRRKVTKDVSLSITRGLLEFQAKHLLEIVDSLFLNEDGSIINKAYARNFKRGIVLWSNRVLDPRVWDSYFHPTRDNNYKEDLCSACRKIVRILHQVQLNKNLNPEYRRSIEEMEALTDSHLVFMTFNIIDQRA